MYSEFLLWFPEVGGTGTIPVPGGLGTTPVAADGADGG